MLLFVWLGIIMYVVSAVYVEHCVPTDRCVRQFARQSALLTLDYRQ